MQCHLSTARFFKIGICGDPWARWFVIADGEYSKRFTRLIVVYAAPAAHKSIAGSSGQMEVALIRHFKSIADERCLNIGEGGEGVSKNTPPPHFTYFVFDDIIRLPGDMATFHE